MWHGFNKVLETFLSDFHFYTTASWSCCGCISRTFILGSSTSQKCCTGLRFDEWWGHWTTRTQCHVQKQKVDMIWALYHGMLSCWYTVVIKDWTSSTIILNHAVAFKQTSVVPRGPKGTHTRQDGSTLLCCLCQFLNLPSECHIEVHTHQTG